MKKAVGVVWNNNGFEVVYFMLFEQPGRDYFQWQTVTASSAGHLRYTDAVAYANMLAEELHIRHISGNEQREPVYLSPIELLVFNLKDN